MPPRRASQNPATPRYGRVGAVAVSAFVCLVALFGGVGVLPSVADDGTTVARDLTGRNGLATLGESAVLVLDAAQNQGEPVSPSDAAGASAESDRPADTSADETLPADSGEGYRVVFSEARQRVWLVDSDGEIERTYPVSGSVYDNLDPGMFEVYSRSEQAYAFDGSGSMKYFVRFAEGDTGAAIGFHDIPLDNSGDLVQTLAQLGTPQSHGCIRQERADAIALWEFAPVGTEVVVV